MFDIVSQFEEKIADFYGAPYAVATDCCTHAIELCLRYTKSNNLTIPTHTYLSIPMTAMKLNLNWQWNDSIWENYYYITENIIDAAVLWKPNSYIPNTYMCVSFQFKKHLSLGRGGIILLDNLQAKNDLIKLSYDGRHRDAPWPAQSIDSLGYHYYMTPETAQLGLNKLEDAIIKQPKIWGTNDYPDLRTMPVFDTKLQ
jgi:dTDP-4-amino-4,6-dideoxygalactose transaminase